MASPSFQQHDITVGGRRIELAELPGDAARRPLVLLHEGLGSVGLWRDFPRRLADATGRRVIAYSRHGHGRSQPPARPRTPAFFAEEADVVLPEVLAATGAAQPILVGHSDGGSIALIHAAGAPVTALVLLAAHVFVEDLTVESIEGIRERYVDGDLRARLARHHDDPDAAFWGWCDVWLDPAFRSWVLDDDARAVDVPALVIQGRDDPYGTLAQVDRIVAGVGPGAQRCIVSGGHIPHVEATDEVVEAITGFCEPLP